MNEKKEKVTHKRTKKIKVKKAQKTRVKKGQKTRVKKGQKTRVKKGQMSKRTRGGALQYPPYENSKLALQNKLNGLKSGVTGILSVLGANSEIMQKIKKLIQGLTLNRIIEIGKFFDVDLENPDSIKNKLTNINKTMNDPVNKEKVKELLKNSAELGALALEAAGPFVIPLSNKVIEAISDILQVTLIKGMQIGLNVAEETPVVGLIIAIVRSLSNAGEALVKSTDAITSVFGESSGYVKGTTENFNLLLRKEKSKGNDILSKTDASMKNVLDVVYPK